MMTQEQRERRRVRDRARYAAAPGRQREATRRWKKANPEKVREIARVWREKDDNAEKMREAHRAWVTANPGKPEAATRRWREANPGKMREILRNWKAANPEKVQEANRLRRARVAGAEGSFTSREFAALCIAYENSCAYCGAKGELHADHAVPLSRGGSNWIENILPACPGCNLRKGTRTDEEFRLVLP